MSTFVETQHPRSTDGKFATKAVDDPPGGTSALAAPLTGPATWTANAEGGPYHYQQGPECAAQPWDGGQAREGYTPATGITEGQNEQFTCRDCHVLAAELGQRTGWPIVTVGADPAVSKVGWVHAGVQRPDGRIIDVEGSWSEVEWLDRHAEKVDAYGYDEADETGEMWDGDCVQVFEARTFGLTPQKLTADTHAADVAAAAKVADVLMPQFGTQAR